MINLVGISGSLREHSDNAGLLRAAAEVVPEGCTLSVNSIRGIPLYDGDEEASQGIPPAVVDLKEKISAPANVIRTVRQPDRPAAMQGHGRQT
jgi:NAD(P)H-dependent FMN reductase